MKYNLVAFVLFFASCNNTNSRDQNTADGAKNSGGPACYAMVTEKDTIMMRLEVRNGIVTGTLVYNFFEKDDNTGTLKGVAKGDTVFADYRFMSEGTVSEREVAFLKKGQAYVEGYGALAERGGKTVFENKDALDFDSNTILSEKDCPE